MSLLFLFVAQELRYGHFFFLSSGARFDLSSEEEIAHISASRPQIKKSKDTLLSPTLKVEEKKVTLVFQFGAQEPRYGHYLIFHVFPFDASL